MARPERHDADYFPFYAKDGRTLFILEERYGCKGTGFFTNVMRFLTLQPDHHFCIADESDRIYFYSKCKCDEVSAEDMLDIMLKTGKLDRPLYQQAMVVASQDHLDSLSDAYRNRRNDCITIELIQLLFNVSCDINNINSDGNSIESVGNTQRKGKETKGNSLSKDKPSATVYSGNHWHQKIGDFYSSIRSLRDQISGFDKNRCAEFNVDSWIQQQASKAAHPGCIEHCLTALVKMSKSSKVTKPWGFLKYIYDRENGNFNEADAIAIHEQLKAMPLPDLKQLTEGMLQSVE